MAARRVGVEIEFAGLDARDAAACLARAIGGTVELVAPHVAVVAGSALGDLKVELDTSYAKPAAEDAPIAKALEEVGTRGLAADILSAVVPVELVTPPITRTDFPILDRAIAALRQAGCEGSEGGLLYAFGLHLNPEVRSEAPEAVVRTVAAFTVVEPWLRRVLEPDPARRLTPFVDPYPEGFAEAMVHAVLTDAWPDLARFVALYAAWNPSRNRGLDLWPLLGHLAPEAASATQGGPVANARPAWHYRLPDSRLGEADWSPLIELDRWEAIEALAADDARLKEAARAMRALVLGDAARETYLERIDAVMS